MRGSLRASACVALHTCRCSGLGFSGNKFCCIFLSVSVCLSVCSLRHLVRRLVSAFLPGFILTSRLGPVKTCDLGGLRRRASGPLSLTGYDRSPWFRLVLRGPCAEAGGPQSLQGGHPATVKWTERPRKLQPREGARHCQAPKLVLTKRPPSRGGPAGLLQSPVSKCRDTQERMKGLLLVLKGPLSSQLIR